jgi:mannose-6-phosphate isomerase-like protein (cupin superfamily)
MAVIRPSEENEYYTDERCFILKMLDFDVDPNVSIARARVEPGVTTALHKLNGVEERYVIEQGKGIVEIGERDGEEVRSGDIVQIPAGTPQRITNTGNRDLVFLCICTPPFVIDCYEHLEQE